MGKVRRMTRPDGRQVAVRLLAEGSTGRTVLFCHPTPGAGTFDPDPEQTALRDITLLGVDRPGYGDSDPLAPDEWATVDRAAGDLADVLESPGAVASRPVGLAGWGAGGRVALALGARRPDLVERIVVFGTPAPESEAPWLPALLRDRLDALRAEPPAGARDALVELFAEVAAGDPSSLRALDLLGGVDLDSASLDAVPGSRQRLAEMLACAFAQGAAGLCRRRGRLLPVPVGLRAIRCEREDAAAVRFAGPVRRQPACDLVTEAPAPGPHGDAAGGWAAGDRAFVEARAVTPDAEAVNPDRRVPRRRRRRRVLRAGTPQQPAARPCTGSVRLWRWCGAERSA